MLPNNLLLLHNVFIITEISYNTLYQLASSNVVAIVTLITLSITPIITTLIVVL